VTPKHIKTHPHGFSFLQSWWNLKGMRFWKYSSWYGKLCNIFIILYTSFAFTFQLFLNWIFFLSKMNRSLRSGYENQLLSHLWIPPCKISDLVFKKNLIETLIGFPDIKYIYLKNQNLVFSNGNSHNVATNCLHKNHNCCQLWCWSNIKSEIP
jgi:hypothetical protein